MGSPYKGLALGLLVAALLVLALYLRLNPEAQGSFDIDYGGDLRVSSFTIQLPVVHGENVFKVVELTATDSEGNQWKCVPGPLGSDKYPDYWVVSGPGLRGNETLTIRFRVTGLRDISYEDYPWMVVNGGRHEVRAGLEPSLKLRLLFLLKDYGPWLVALLLAASAAVFLAGMRSR